MAQWKLGSQILAGVGVLMSAMQVSLLDILPHPWEHIYVSIQTGVIALGLYLLSQSTVDKEST